MAAGAREARPATGELPVAVVGVPLGLFGGTRLFHEQLIVEDVHAVGPSHLTGALITGRAHAGRAVRGRRLGTGGGSVRQEREGGGRLPLAPALRLVNRRQSASRRHGAATETGRRGNGLRAKNTAIQCLNSIICGVAASLMYQL